MHARDKSNHAEVTPDEMRFAMETGAAAASGRTPQSSVGAYGVTVAPPGQGDELSFEDTPDNRAMFAIAAQFDGDKFKAIMTRIGAMMEALQDDRAKPYIQRSTIGLPGDEVDEAVVDVAATFPLNERAQFDASEFFGAVARAVKASGTT